MTLIRTAAAGLLAAGLLFSAASGAFAQGGFDLTPEQTARPKAEANPEAIAKISPDFKPVTPGALTVALTVGDPPLSTYATDSSTPVGVEEDTASIIADALGLKLVLVPVAWPDWPLGLESGKFDAVISNVTVTEARKEKFDFSSYRLDVLGFYVPNESKITEIKEPKDIAGLKVIVGAGTNQEKIVVEWDKQNVAAGLPAAEFQYYDDTAAAQLALQSGRADVEFNPNAQLAYRAVVSGNTRLVGIVNGGWPLTAEIAVATRKGAGLADALTAAINGLIANGKYIEALKRWGLDAEKLPESRTNPPGLPKT
ncbi:ABC transporter substrate-binding protein [Devosia sp. LjRoot16]|jgi:polar amino acid transport system substrate-binding protein|uniref:ABC transporter substrate-binding protein n=1 Tax=Devosia sp. LjRoot16 TaxID=3342271 RepID=UPI003ECF1A96